MSLYILRSDYFSSLILLLLLYIHWVKCEDSVLIQFYKLTSENWDDLNLEEKLKNSVATTCQTYCSKEPVKCGLVNSTESLFSPTSVETTELIYKRPNFNTTVLVRNSKNDLLSRTVLEEIFLVKEPREIIQNEVGYFITLINSERFNPPPPATENIVISVIMTLITLALIAASCIVHKLSDKQIIDHYVQTWHRASCGSTLSQTQTKDVETMAPVNGNIMNNSNNNRPPPVPTSVVTVHKEGKSQPNNKPADAMKKKTSELNGTALTNGSNNGNVAGINEPPEVLKNASNQNNMSLSPVPPFDSVPITETESTTPSSTYKHPPPKPLQRPVKSSPESSPTPPEEDNMVVEDLKMSLIENSDKKIENEKDKSQISTETSKV